MKSPKPPNLPHKSLKPSFFYGHCKPSQNRPIVYDGLFSNHQSLSIDSPQSQSNTVTNQTPFDLFKWDPEEIHLPSKPPSSSPMISASSERLSLRYYKNSIFKVCNFNSVDFSLWLSSSVTASIHIAHRSFFHYHAGLLCLLA